MTEAEGEADREDEADLAEGEAADEAEGEAAAEAEGEAAIEAEVVTETVAVQEQPQRGPKVPMMATLVLVPPPVKVLVVQGPPMPPVLVQDWDSSRSLPAQVSGKAPVHSALVLSAMYLDVVRVSTTA